MSVWKRKQRRRLEKLAHCLSIEWISNREIVRRTCLNVKTIGKYMGFLVAQGVLDRKHIRQHKGFESSSFVLYKLKCSLSEEEVVEKLSFRHDIGET